MIITSQNAWNPSFLLIFTSLMITCAFVHTIKMSIKQLDTIPRELYLRVGCSGEGIAGVDAIIKKVQYILLRYAQEKASPSTPQAAPPAPVSLTTLLSKCLQNKKCTYHILEVNVGSRLQEQLAGVTVTIMGCPH